LGESEAESGLIKDNSVSGCCTSSSGFVLRLEVFATSVDRGKSDFLFDENHEDKAL
jgi:hypothetical protein